MKFNLQKISKNKAKADDIAFKPVKLSDMAKKQNEFSASAETFMNTQPGFILKGPIWIIFLITFAALIYSFIAKIETKVTSVINIDGEKYMVQSPVTGSISSVIVSENEEIEANQQILNILSEETLVVEEELENLKNSISENIENYNHVQITLNQIIQLAIDLSKEVKRLEVDIPNEAKSMKDDVSSSEYTPQDPASTWKESEYFSRMSAFNIQLNDAKDAYQRALKVFDKQETIYNEDKDLFNRGVITETEYAGSYQGFLSAQANVENSVSNFKLLFYNTIQELLNERKSIYKNIKKLRTTLDEQKLLEDQVIIDGRVAIVNSKYPGVVSEIFVKPYEYVSRGVVMLKLIRNDLPKSGIVYVGNQNIGKIKRGQRVFVKLEAYPYQDYGAQIGRIVSVSPDVKVVEGFGYVYEARVSFEEVNPRVNLKYGMRGTAEIETGEKRLIEIVFGPMTKVFDYLSGKTD